jgi:hypothetical protein
MSKIIHNLISGVVASPLHNWNDKPSASGVYFFMETKICFTCKIEKPKSEFYSNKSRSNGVYGSCIECVKKTLKYPKSSENEIIYLPEHLSSEEWIQIKIGDIECPYMLSDCGRIKLPNGKMAKPSFDQRGYPQIILTCNKKRIGRRIHVLVGKCFIPNPNNLREVNHKNGNKLWPHKSNLEWSSSKNNTDHAFANGLRVPYNSSNHPKSKKVIDTATKIEYPSAIIAAKSIGMRSQDLCAKLNGRRKNTTTMKYI